MSVGQGSAGTYVPQGTTAQVEPNGQDSQVDQEAPEGAEGDGRETGPDFKAEARKWEQRAKQNAVEAKRAKALETELEKLREQSQSETEKLINAARREAAQQARAEAIGKYAKELAAAEARAAAGGLFANPNLAVKLVDLDEFLDDEGNVDAAGIKAAVAQALKENPGLGVKASTVPSFDGGSRSSAAPVDDFNKQLRKGFGFDR